MSENLFVPQNVDKKEKYLALVPQMAALMEGEPDSVANLGNFAAVLKTAFGFFWVGFYVVKGKELVLGPFQGPPACTRISYGKGVCGKAWEEGKTQLVSDVDAFPGHIACSAASKSEIVIPIFQNGNVKLVLDIDSDKLNDFDETDQEFLEQLTKLIPLSEE